MVDATESTQPYAVGVHLPWSDAPEAIRRWVEATLGPVAAARDLVGGFSPGCCTLLGFDDGRSAFVKAVGAELNATSPRLHRREARVAAAMPRSAQVPHLIESYDDGVWVALLYEEVPGAMPRHPWDETELTTVIEGLASLHEALTPCPVEDLEPTSERTRSALSGWRTLAGLSTLPDGLDEWSRRHLERLAELESACADAVDNGDTLVHGDVRSDNVLVQDSSVVFVDWPHASRGAPVFDLVAWAPSVVLEGGPDPESLLARYRLGANADPDEVTAVVAGVAGFFAHQALLPPESGLPTLRSFQDEQGQVMRAWLRQRTGWT